MQIIFLTTQYKQVVEGTKLNNAPRNNWKQLFEVNFSYNSNNKKNDYSLWISMK